MRPGCSRAGGILPLLWVVLTASAFGAELRVHSLEVMPAELRDTDGPVRVRWSVEPAGSPVDLYVGGSADLDAMELHGAALTGTEVVLEDRDARWFALVPHGERTGGRFAGRRVLPLEGGRNFRDLGGYPTEDGRRVRWGRLYRSGTMVDLTEADYAWLDGLDVQVLLDLRSNEERIEEPTAWTVDEPVYLARSYSSADDSGALREVFSSGELTPDAVRAAMASFYRELPRTHAPAYRELFERLAEDETPLVFNCSAGKDRTGVAAALVLTALGVPRRTVLADYALSDELVDYGAAFTPRNGEAPAEDSPWAFLSRLPPATVAPLLESDPAYLASALEAIEAEHGSIDAYLRDVLAVDEGDLTALRARLLVD